jgi:CelD/BcsL family acetyltransferase involved in cellulose biosynthesis
MSEQGARWDVYAPDALPAEWWTQWDALNVSLNHAHPLLASHMARVLITHTPDIPKWYARLRAGSRVAGMAVLTRAQSRRWDVFTPWQAPLALLLLEPALASRTTFNRLLSSLPGYGLSLNIPALDPSLLAGSTGADLCERATLGTTIAVAADKGFEAYWSERSKDLRKNVKRYFNRLAQGNLQYELRCLTAPEQVGAAVDRYGLLESLGWKGSNGTALHPENSQGRLYRDLMGQFAASGAARAYELYIGDELAASRLIASGPTMHVILKTSYRETLQQYAPGRMLLYLMLEKLLSEPDARRVEFYTRANKDQLSWASSQRDLFAATVYRNSFVRLAVRMRRRLRAAPPAAQAQGDAAAAAG